MVLGCSPQSSCLLRDLGMRLKSWQWCHARARNANRNNKLEQISGPKSVMKSTSQKHSELKKWSWVCNLYNFLLRKKPDRRLLFEPLNTSGIFVKPAFTCIQDSLLAWVRSRLRWNSVFQYALTWLTINFRLEVNSNYHNNAHNSHISSCRSCRALVKSSTYRGSTQRDMCLSLCSYLFLLRPFVQHIGKIKVFRNVDMEFSPLFLVVGESNFWIKHWRCCYMNMNWTQAGENTVKCLSGSTL